MNTHLQTALHLVGLGFLGVIASNVSGGIIFGLAGYIAFLFAAAVGVGAFIRAVREGCESLGDTPRAKTAVDPYANVPTDVNPVRRARQPYSSL